MKKITLILSFIVFAVACATEQKKEETAAESKPAVVEEAKDPDVEKGLELVAQSDCLTCHKVSEASVGPAYKLVANKYEKTDAVIDTLAGKIIAGGSGNWGTVPMTPHPAISKEDARTMVKYILSLKD